MSSELAGLIKGLYDVRQQKSDLEKIEKSILEELKPLANPKFDELDEPITSEGLVLSRTTGMSRSISGELLLERGVSPEIVSYATKETPYFQYRVKPVKDKTAKKPSK